MVQGSAGTSTITITISGGFDAGIVLSATGQGPAQTVKFSPAGVKKPGAGTSTMTVTVGATAAVGTHTITVTGKGGGLTNTTTVTLKIVK